MKKLFTILTVVALATTTSFAQFSAKAGLNMANITTNIDDADNGMKLGMIIGCGYAMELSDAMSLDISATFKQSGTKNTEESSTTTSGVTVETESSGSYGVNYLDISPSLVFNASDQFGFSFGPYLAFAMSGKAKSESTTTISGAGSLDGSTTTSSEEDLKFGTGDDDDFKGMDFGINVGSTFFITEMMSISAGYSLGLTNLLYLDDDTKKAFDDANEDHPKISNTGIYIAFGYTFGG